MTKLKKFNNIIVNTIKEFNKTILNALIKADKAINVLKDLIVINIFNIAEVD